MNGGSSIRYGSLCEREAGSRELNWCFRAWRLGLASRNGLCPTFHQPPHHQDLLYAHLHREESKRIYIQRLQSNIGEWMSLDAAGLSEAISFDSSTRGCSSELSFPNIMNLQRPR